LSRKRRSAFALTLANLLVAWIVWADYLNPVVDLQIVDLEGSAETKQQERFTKHEDFVFCRPDGDCIDRSAARLRFVLAQRAAGLRVRRLHDLCHTFGSLAIRKFDLVAVQAMMGHSKTTTTQRYLRSKPQADDAAKLTAIFAEGEEAELMLAT
jgi:integrase